MVRMRVNTPEKRSVHADFSLREFESVMPSSGLFRVMAFKSIPGPAWREDRYFILARSLIVLPATTKVLLPTWRKGHVSRAVGVA